MERDRGDEMLTSSDLHGSKPSMPSFDCFCCSANKGGGGSGHSTSDAGHTNTLKLKGICVGKRVHRSSEKGVWRYSLFNLKTTGKGGQLGDETEDRNNTYIVIMYVQS